MPTIVLGMNAELPGYAGASLGAVDLKCPAVVGLGRVWTVVSWVR